MFLSVIEWERFGLDRNNIVDFYEIFNLKINVYWKKLIFIKFLNLDR